MLDAIREGIIGIYTGMATRILESSDQDRRTGAIVLGILGVLGIAGALATVKKAQDEKKPRLARAGGVLALASFDIALVGYNLSQLSANSSSSSNAVMTELFRHTFFAGSLIPLPLLISQSGLSFEVLSLWKSKGSIRVEISD